jgi:hypothetical protein
VDVYTSLFVLLTSTLLGGGWSASRPCLFIPAEGPAVHIMQQTGWAQRRNWKFCSLPELRLQPLGRPARSRSHVCTGIRFERGRTRNTTAHLRCYVPSKKLFPHTATKAMHRNAPGFAIGAVLIAASPTNGFTWVRKKAPWQRHSTFLVRVISLQCHSPEVVFRNCDH